MNEYKQVGEIIVNKYHILCTDYAVVAAYEPCTGGFFTSHSTVTHIDGKQYGRVSTKRLPEDLDALPKYSVERSKAVGEWFDSEYNRAYEAIYTAYPELRDDMTAMRDMGEVTVVIKKGM